MACDTYNVNGYTLVSTNKNYYRADGTINYVIGESTGIRLRFYHNNHYCEIFAIYRSPLIDDNSFHSCLSEDLAETTETFFFGR